MSSGRIMGIVLFFIGLPLIIGGYQFLEPGGDYAQGYVPKETLADNPFSLLLVLLGVSMVILGIILTVAVKKK